MRNNKDGVHSALIRSNLWHIYLECQDQLNVNLLSNWGTSISNLWDVYGPVCFSFKVELQQFSFKDQVYPSWDLFLFILPWVSTAGIKLVWKHLDLQQLELSKFGEMGCGVNGWKPRNGQTRNWWFAFLLCRIFFIDLVYSNFGIAWVFHVRVLDSGWKKACTSTIVSWIHFFTNNLSFFTSIPVHCIQVIQRFGLHVVFGRCSSIHRCKWTEDRVPYLQGVSVPSSSPSLDKRRKDTTEASCQTVVLWKDDPIWELAFLTRKNSTKTQPNATKKKNRTTSGTALSVQSLHYLQMHPHLRASHQAWDRLRSWSIVR